MENLEEEFTKLTLNEKLKLYLNHYDKKNKEILISNYEKKSKKITNEKFKKLKLIKTKDEFKKFFKKYNIYLILDIDIKEDYININYILNKKILVCNHSYQPIGDRVHNKGDGRGKYLNYKCIHCGNRYKKFLKKK